MATDGVIGSVELTLSELADIDRRQAEYAETEARRCDSDGDTDGAAEYRSIAERLRRRAGEAQGPRQWGQETGVR